MKNKSSVPGLRSEFPWFLEKILPSMLQVTYLSMFGGLVSYAEYTHKICSVVDLAD